MKRIAILGEKEQSGAYLLRMHVKREMMVRFGRFQGGRPVLVPKGEVVYVGSAMAQQGSMTLARRLLRHATRCDVGNPQPVREAMLALFEDAGMGPSPLKPPVSKKLFWNIDFLLEEVDVDLSHVVVIRATVRLEDELASFLEREPGSIVLAKGLGAHDRSGDTHLYMMREIAAWWQDLPVHLERVLEYAEIH